MAEQGPRASGVLSRQLILSLYVPATPLALGQSMVAPIILVLTRTYDVGLAEASLVIVAVSLGAVVEAGATVAPLGYAFVPQHVSYGAGFISMAACALMVVGVEGVLGNTQGRTGQKHDG